MTSPGLAQDALIVTLVPGQSGQLVSEYMPASGSLVINTGPTTVYLGANSSVGAGNGVPVGPGAAVPWIFAGPLYAIADPAGTANATVLATSRISGWEPSPAALAAATAVALEAQGIPNVGLFSTLRVPQVLAGGANAVFDVSMYASVTILALQFNGGVAINAKVEQGIGTTGSAPALQTVMDTDYVTAIPAAVAGVGVAMPVTGPVMRITNTAGGNPYYLTVVGSNRTVPVAKVLGDKTPSRKFTNTAILAAGAAVLLAPADGNTDGSTGFNGGVTIAINTPVQLDLYQQYQRIDNAQELEPFALVPAGISLIHVAHSFGRVGWYVLNASGATAAAASSIVAYVAPDTVS